jgi:hypothetical protein
MDEMKFIATVVELGKSGQGRAGAERRGRYGAVWRGLKHTHTLSKLFFPQSVNIE